MKASQRKGYPANFIPHSSYLQTFPMKIFGEADMAIAT